jgi:hypothetical protein
LLIDRTAQLRQQYISRRVWENGYLLALDANVYKVLDDIFGKFLVRHESVGVQA